MLRLRVHLSESTGKFAADASGTTAIEYGLIEYGLIAAGIAVASSRSPCSATSSPRCSAICRPR